MSTAGRDAEARLHRMRSSGWRRALVIGVVLSGGFMAFSLGSNNVGNAIGPAIGRGVLSSQTGLLIGGAALAVGAALFGGRVLETSAKHVTELNLISGSTVNVVTGPLVLGASFVGVPVPIVQTMASATMGADLARRGRAALSRQLVRDIVTVWVASPVVSLVLAYTLAHLVVDASFVERPLTHVLLVLGGVFVFGTFLMVNRLRLRQVLRIARKAAPVRSFLDVLRVG